MILSAQSIERRHILDPLRRAERFAGTSRGLGPAGYDLSLVLPAWAHGPDEGQPRQTYTLVPGAFLLAAAEEKFDMPDDLVGIVHDKSTWARRGLSVFNTVVEPGWRGWLTLELVNHGPESLTLEAGQGIAQVVFQMLDMATAAPYDGKYQDQAYGPVGARP